MCPADPRPPIGVLESVRAWWRRVVGERPLRACAACGEDARHGARVCRDCLKAARRALRDETGEGGRPRYRTLMGLMVQSEGEAAIADHLFAHGVPFQYEPPVGRYRPDFLVPHERLIVEYYGMKNADYHERRRRKEKLYEELGYRVVAVRRQDLNRLGELLKGLGDAPPGLKAELKRQRDRESKD